MPLLLYSMSMYYQLTRMWNVWLCLNKETSPYGVLPFFSDNH